MPVDNPSQGNPEVKRILSLDLTGEQQKELRLALGDAQAFRRLHIDEMTGKSARSFHPSLVMFRVVVACW
jgi:hypothetical protein